MTNWYICLSFSYIFPFWYFVPRKIWQPRLDRESWSTDNGLLSRLTGLQNALTGLGGDVQGGNLKIF
jgi:hypothetical protein